MGGHQRFFPSDARVVEHPQAFDSAILFTLNERLKGLADTFNRYREDQLSPGSVWDTWVDPSVAGAPSPYGGGTLLIDHDLGFPAHSVAVDNPASQWLFVEPANRIVPPYSLGWVFAVTSAGSTNARVAVRQPLGTKAYALVPGERFYIAYHEASLRPAPGFQLPSNIITGVPA